MEIRKNAAAPLKKHTPLNNPITNARSSNRSSSTSGEPPAAVTRFSYWTNTHIMGRNKAMHTKAQAGHPASRP